MFSAIAELAKRGLPLDYATLGRELMQRKQLDAIDGLSYLAELTEGMPPIVPANLLKWCNGIKEASVRRKGLAVAQVMSNRLLTDPATGVDEILSAGVERVQGLRGQVDTDADLNSLPSVFANQEEFEFLIRPELPMGAVVGFTGEAGSGKSTLLTALARNALAAGYSVLVLDRENTLQVVQERLRRLRVADNDQLKWWGYWHSEPPAPTDPRVAKWMKRQEKGTLVILDSLGAFYAGDENSADEMNAFLRPLKEVAALGGCVAVLHNTGKSDTAKDYRGSSAFKDALDQAFVVTNDGTEGSLDRVTVRCFKPRYGFSGSLIYRYNEGLFTRDERPEAVKISTAEDLTSILRANPGISGSKFEELATKAGLARQLAREFIANGVLGELISRRRAAHGAWHYFLIDT